MSIKTDFSALAIECIGFENNALLKKRDSNPNIRPTDPSTSQVSKHHTPMNTVMGLKAPEEACKLTFCWSCGVAKLLFVLSYYYF